jgi:predicted RNA binding protein YcfA (HicA-like mRNA interferase family)
MSERLRALTAKRVIRKLEKAGFRKTHQRGSHVSLKNPKNGRVAVVPLHGKDIPIGTLRNIVIYQAGLSIEEFNKL